MAIKFLSGQTIDGTLTVSGNVQGATFNSLPIETSQTNNNVNKIVRTTVNGYVNFGWINSISGNHTGSITRITASNDQYLRYVTPAQFRTGVTDGYYAPVSTVTGVTSVATTNGITGGTIISTGTIQVDSTVIRTTGGQTIANVTTLDDLDVIDTLAWRVSSTDAARQRADARDDATSFSRLHWFGKSATAGTSNFRHAYYDGANYINVTAASGAVTFTGILAATGGNSTEWNTSYDNSITGLAVTGTTTKTLTATQQDGGTLTASWTDNNTGTVTSVVAGNGLAGGTITTTGTLSTVHLPSFDTRSVNPDPEDYANLIRFDFKANGTNGLNDGGGYNGQMTWRSYGSGSDLTGGQPIRLAYTANGNLWRQMGTSATSWGSWAKFALEPSGGFLPLSGGTMTGSINMGSNNITSIGSGLSLSGYDLTSTVGLNLKVDSGNVSAITIDNVGSTTFSGYTYFPNYLFHAGDTNTRIGFTTGVVTIRGDSGITLDGPTTAETIRSDDLFAKGMVRATGWYNTNTGNGTGYGVEIGQSGGQGYILSYSRDAAAYQILNLVGSYTLIANSTRSPVYYDTNTAYYGDFASSTWALNTAGSLKIIGGVGSDGDGASSVNQAVRVSMPNGASYSIDSGVTGALKIRLPVRANNTMWSMKVRIYSYATNQTSEYTIGNYSYSNGGYNSSVSFQGAAGMEGRQVRWGNDGTYDCVWIGETNSSWSYPVVSVMDFNGGFRSGNAATWTNNWDISLVTSFGTVQTAYYPSTQVGSIGYATDSFRAPVFYDSDNTAYYVDPGGGNNFKGVTQFNTDAGNLRGYIQATDVNDSHLIIATSGGEDIAFKDGGTGGGVNMVIRGDGDVIITRNLYARTFYDQDNTGYYVDPSSVSNVVTFRSEALGTNTSGSQTNQNGLSLYGAYSGGLPTYGMLFSGTAGLGTYGGVTGTWATYFTMNTSAGRGWIFRDVNGSGNVASINNDGWAQFAASVRSPIFYDSNDTSYFVNPASTSKFNEIWSTDGGNNVTAPRWDTSFYVAQSQHYYGHSSTQTMYLGESNTINIRSIGIASGSFRAPIFYDSDNTAYYGDFAGTSQLNVLNCAGTLTVTGAGGVIAPKFTDYNNGSFYLDPSSTGTSLNVAGDVVAYASSDIRFKNNITPITNALDKINKIGGYTFEWNEKSHKETGKKDIGVIAQEVEEILPEIVDTRDNGYKAVDYSKLTALLIQSVKEQQVIIDNLKSRIETLENN